MKNQRGFTLYLVLGALLVMGAMGFALKVQSSRLASSKAETAAVQVAYDSFVAKTKALGDAAELKARAQEKERAALTKKTEKEHATRTQSLTTQLANAVAAARVRDKPNAGSGGVPNLSSAASSISCPDRQADIAGRLERLEVGILERLVGRGNAAIERTVFCKEYLDGQAAVKP